MSGFLIVKVLKQGENHGVELFQGTYEEAVEKAKASLSDEIVKALLFEEVAEVESAPVVRSVKAPSLPLEKTKEQTSKSSSAAPTKQQQTATIQPKLLPLLLKDSFGTGSALVQCSCGNQFSYSSTQTSCTACKQPFPMDEARLRRYA